ncbi:MULTISPECIES: SIMPL domain-containing protein [unclassified Microbacterium]|uniref:SIMPL domain-containing protein n=1 Tax=unclassified Microbacterium TaxID=2609290 RepID=UPI0006FD85BE|nr:SIMPL domain-containing protein [Microbacterium sp. Leaf436]KQT72661.1 neuraminidase [Microbacterium sp. Leaf436]
MSEVVVTVRGESEARVRAEEAAVRVTVSTDGPSRGPVIEGAQVRASSVQDGLVAHLRSGEVSEWSSARVSVWSDRPWNSDGAQLPLVHHASVELSATFTDAGALSWWLGDVTESDDVQVIAVEWRLSPATRVRVESDVAAAAVHVAVERAGAYAGALGLASVSPVEIADAGLLGARPEPTAHLSARFAAASDSSGPSFSLQPPEIVVRSVVEGRFRAE